MPRALVIAAAIVLTGPAHAQDATPPDKIADSFFRYLQTGQFTKAYQDVWRGTPMDKKQADVETITTQTASALQIYGKIDGWEFVSEKVVAPSFQERTYLLRTDRGPLFFRMQFYRRPTGWSVYRIDFADTLPRLPKVDG
jgi:hypothetical protein